jgi:hypothetical protein
MASTFCSCITVWMRKPCGSGVPAILVAIAALQVLVSAYSSWIVKKPGSIEPPGFWVTFYRGQQNLLIRYLEGLNPLMPFLTMVKTGMPYRQSAGLLASGTLSRAIFSNKHILNNAAGALVFFDGTTNDDGVCFV